MSERWRCFVAVPLDDGLRYRLADAMAAWTADPRTDGLRWIQADALHLTLAFLGDVDADRVPALQPSIEDVARHHSAVLVRTGRLGAFARSSSARVLWYGVQDAAGAVRALADDLVDALGLDPAEEPYRPHITLARARRGWLDLRGWIEEASLSAPDARLSVSAVDLMRSHLGQGPARYETLASVRLG